MSKKNRHGLNFLELPTDLMDNQHITSGINTNQRIAMRVTYLRGWEKKNGGVITKIPLKKQY